MGFTKKLRTLFILLVFSMLQVADARETLVGKEAFDKVFSHLQSSLNKKAGYTEEKYYKGNDIHLKSTGELVILEDKALFFAQHEPFNLTIVMTPDRIMEILDDEKNVIDKESKPLVFNFTGLIFRLLNKDKSLYSDFESQLTVEDKNLTLVLKPLDSLLKKLIKEVVITGLDSVKTIVITMHNGDYSHMEFGDFTGLDGEDKKNWMHYLEF